MGLFKRKPKKKAIVVIAGSMVDAGVLVPDQQHIAPVAVMREQFKMQSTSMGMQGYAPGVVVSKNRRRCEGCKELVNPNVRHICMYNAEHYLDTMIDEERETVIRQLTADRKKDRWL